MRIISNHQHVDVDRCTHSWESYCDLCCYRIPRHPTVEQITEDHRRNVERVQVIILLAVTVGILLAFLINAG